jgi:hypothetical protein
MKYNKKYNKACIQYLLDATADAVIGMVKMGMAGRRGSAAREYLNLADARDDLRNMFYDATGKRDFSALCRMIDGYSNEAERACKKYPDKLEEIRALLGQYNDILAEALLRKGFAKASWEKIRGTLLDAINEAGTNEKPRLRACVLSIA